MSALVTPGERLGRVSDFKAGAGTYIKDNFIVASLVGLKQTRQAQDTPLPYLEVVPAGPRPIVPSVGDIVTARVNRIHPRLAVVDILCVGDSAVAHTYTGVIRTQDIRSTEIDKVKTQDCFRPGDLVKAEVLSLGDSRSYYLSTAKDELGVVYARSLTTGAALLSIDNQSMQCPVSQAIELRKVARQ